jgi:competence protein ComEA
LNAIITFFFFLLASATVVEAAPLQRLDGCAFVPTSWADGDSFRVRTPGGDEHTVRLYAADCLESQVNDTTDARRLRAQRRYFGITRVDPDPGVSIGIAKEYGKQAAEETARILSKPFTIYSSFADARGDGRHKRVYAFVITHDGRDLAAHLVSQGLARAFGVYRKTHDGMSHSDYRDQLADLELQAATRGHGVWSRTDWDALPAERQKQREEDAEARLAMDDQPLPVGEKINPNTAARDELMKLPGIGEKFANRIVEGRPYSAPSDLTKVNGIGPGTLAKIAPYLSFSSNRSNRSKNSN